MKFRTSATIVFAVRLLAVTGTLKHLGAAI